MSPAIQLLMMNIVQIGVLLAVDKRFIVFTETCNHTYRVSVRIYTPDSVWRNGSPDPTLVASANVRWEPYNWEQTDATKHTAALTEIQQQLAFMHAALHAYLPAALTLHMEAAA